jgi:hypothetical protein
MPTRHRRHHKDPAALRERNRLAGLASQRPEVLIRRLARMDLTDAHRQQLTELAHQGSCSSAAGDIAPSQVMLTGCPYCGAAPGDVCRTAAPGRHSMGARFHGDRHQAAMGQAASHDAA